MDWSLAHVEERIAAHQTANRTGIATPQRAAVAALLRYRRTSPEVLLMQRATRPGDRWSGQVSFPGGHQEKSDPDLRATAVREAREEVGLDLDRSARLLGPIDSIRAMAHGKILPMSITPFVFAQTRAVEPVLGDEAIDTFWLPLEVAASGDLDDVHPFKKGPLKLRLPCWRYHDKVVWGLTYQMLNVLLRIIRS